MQANGALNVVERRRERKRMDDEAGELGRKLPELKVEYARLLRQDNIEAAGDAREEAVEVFERIQDIERTQFFDSLDMIGRCSTVRAVEIAERLLAEALQAKMGGPAYESMSADGSTCVVIHEGVVPVRRFPSDYMHRAKSVRRRSGMKYR